MTKGARHLLDVNGLIALITEDHVHHRVMKDWFEPPGLQWALCAFTEAGVLRYLTRQKMLGIRMEVATSILANLAQQASYHYQGISADWQTLTRPFAKRIFGHNQITDAYLLGLAVRENLVLVTFDRAMLHLAGEYREHVLLLGNDSI